MIIFFAIYIYFYFYYIFSSDTFANHDVKYDVNHNLKHDELLTLKNCVDELIKNNQQLQAEIKNVESNRFLLKGSYSGLYPQVNANLGYNYEEYENKNSVTSAIITNTNKNYNMTLSATQNLFSGLQDFAKIQRADANLNIAKIKYDLLKAKLSYDLMSAYVELLYTQKLLKLNQDIIKRRKENYTFVQLRFEGGRENKGAVLLSKAYADQAKYDLLQNTQNIQVVRSKLANILGREDKLSFNFIVDENVPTNEPLAKSFVESTVNVKDLVKLTPAYLQVVAEERVGKANLKLAQSAFYPSLNLNGGFGRQDDHLLPQRDRWSVGVTLTFPLFSGGKDYYGTKSAVEEVVILSSKRRDLNMQLQSDLREAYSKYLLSVEKLKVDSSFLEAAIIRAQIAKSKYNNGLISFDDWDLIENELITRQKNVLQSYKERILAEAHWQEVQGKGVIP
ncbi:MAG: TolC family protein [Oligoflexia bacterium]|nr:TolC family protein [Oligoflexia bacterium]